jgi:hypothetical protein
VGIVFWVEKEPMPTRPSVIDVMVTTFDERVLSVGHDVSVRFLA